MTAPPTGTVTFLYTDIEGSTRLWEERPAAMRPAIDRHFALLRDAIAAHGGHVFRTQGDGLCAAFATAPPALATALAAQLALHREPWPSGAVLRIRMALHTGAAEAQDGDYVGACLNRIGRLLGIGHGGQTLLSRTTYDLVREALPAGASLGDLGATRCRTICRCRSPASSAASGSWPRSGSCSRAAAC
jgi:class 3 adenylate cyclase